MQIVGVQKTVNMKKLLADHHTVQGDKSGKAVIHLGRDEYKLDKYGRMPELECFLKKREDEESFEFFFRVFGPAICGTSFGVDMFSEGRQYKDTLSIFTESDEAYGLFILDDNWDVWHEQAKDDFKKDCDAMNLVVRGITSCDDGEEQSDGKSVENSSCSLSDEHSVWCDVIGYDNRVYRRKIKTKKIVGQRYSSKGMTDVSQQRLRELEMEVHEDRKRRGEVFYDRLKRLVAPEILAGGQSKQEIAEEDDYRMM
jgi:hypothetical protein